MRTCGRLLGVGLVAFALLAVPAVAAAGGSMYDWNSEESPVLFTNDSGVFFLGSDLQVDRAYSWDRAGGQNKQSLFMVDVDKDGSTEVVGAGDPTFILAENGDPLWTIEEGCRQVIVADFAAADKLDLMCNRGTAVHIHLHDRQKVWSLDPGLGLDFCRAGDINGDLKMDLECEFDDRDGWIRLDADGKILAKSSTEQEIPDDAIDLDAAQPVPAEVWNGGREYDLNGDGATEESITTDGSSIVIQSRSKKVAVARTSAREEVQAAMVKNVDGEGNPEIVALTSSEIVVMDGAGEIQEKFPANARNYSREPVAEFDSVYARKFSDKEKATSTVRDASDDFAECYADQVRSKFPTGTGQVILKGYIGSGGTVDDIELMHSEVNNSEVESCAREVLRGLDYPKPASANDEESDENATVNVVLQYTFSDRP